MSKDVVRHSRARAQCLRSRAPIALTKASPRRTDWTSPSMLVGEEVGPMGEASSIVRELDAEQFSVALGGARSSCIS